MSNTTMTAGRGTATVDDFPQYTGRQVAAIWLAVTVPMSVLGWVVAPLAAHVVHTRDPFIDCLVVAFDLGLLWMIAFALLVVRRERGSLSWPSIRDALRLGAPRDPRTGRGWRRVWVWALGFTILSVALNTLPIDPMGPLPRDLPNALLTTRVQDYFAGNWPGYGLMVLNAFAAPIAEELVFRGMLLPRTRALFGRGNAAANGALFAAYHLHQPWGILSAFLDGAITQAYSSQRFGSTWMGLIAHTSPSFVVCGVLLSQVLA